MHSEQAFGTHKFEIINLRLEYRLFNFLYNSFFNYNLTTC